jgi:hypothetical protein
MMEEEKPKINFHHMELDDRILKVYKAHLNMYAII